MIQAWYQGGASVIDFTDSSNPVEMAFFDRGPVSADALVMGGYWSTYWYRGYIYGTEIARGLDVLRLLPSEYVTDNEIAAASLVAPDFFNAQQQRQLDWPAQPVVARAYLDQLVRNDAVATERATALTDALDRADQLLAGGASTDASAADQLQDLATALAGDGARATGRDQTRFRALAATVSNLAESLR